MPKRYTGENVFDSSLDRIRGLYEAGHRVVVSMSGGKDSTVCFELARIAAQETGRMPVDVTMRDEEVMFPGTFEYCERLFHRADTNFKWIVAGQPIINAFSRTAPYWWVFDPLVEDKWVRRPPDFATRTDILNIHGICNRDLFPPDDGKELYCFTGLRTEESPHRKMGIFSSKGWLTKAPNRWGSRHARPIYDWSDGDVWKAIKDNEWDYNSAYDVMHRHGMARNSLRIAPPTLAIAGLKSLAMASRA